MPIAVQCTCGKKIDAPDKVAGKMIACPACQIKIKVPIPIIQTLPLQIECSCGVKLEIPSSMAGKNIDCPVCKKKMKVHKTISHEEPIRGTCDHCNYELEVSVNMAGKRVRCPSCKQGKVRLSKAIVASTPVHTKCICGRIIDAPGEMAGKKIRCPSCKAKIRLPRALVLAEGQPAPLQQILSKPEIRKRLEQDITITLENVPFYRPNATPTPTPTPAPLPFLVPTAVPTTPPVSGQSPMLMPEGLEGLPFLEASSTPSEKPIQLPEDPMDSHLKNKEAGIHLKTTAPARIPAGTPRRNKVYSYERQKSKTPEMAIIGSVALFACIAIYMVYFQNTFSTALQYIPESCNVVGAINFRLLFNIPEFAEAVEKSKESPSYKILFDAGFSPENIQAIYFGGKFKPNDDSSGAFFFLSSKAPMKLNTLLEEMKKMGLPMGKTENSGYPLYHQLHNPEVLIGQLNSTLLIGGNFSMVNAGILAYSKGSQNKLSQEMFSLIEYDRSDLFWLACITPKSSKEEESLLPIPVSIDKINKFLFSVNYDVGILLDGRLICADAETATKLKEGAQEIISTGANPKTGLKAEYFQVTSENKEVAIRIEIPESVLKKVMGKSVTPEQLYTLPEMLGLSKKKIPSPLSNRPKIIPLEPQKIYEAFPVEALQLKNTGRDFSQALGRISANSYYKIGKGKEEQYLKICIEDLGETPEDQLEKKYPWIFEEVQISQQNAITYKEMRYCEKIEKGKLSLSVLAGTRFVVSLEGTNLPLKQLLSVNLTKEQIATFETSKILNLDEKGRLEFTYKMKSQFPKKGLVVVVDNTAPDSWKFTLQEEKYILKLEKNTLNIYLENSLKSVLNLIDLKKLDPTVPWVEHDKIATSPFARRTPSATMLDPSKIGEIFPSQILHMKGRVSGQHGGWRGEKGAVGYYEGTNGQEKQTLAVTIEDLENVATENIGELHFWIYKEIQNPQQKTGTYMGMKTYEEYSNERCLFYILAGTRFVVTLESTNIPIETLKQVLSFFPLKKLDPTVPWVK